EFRRVLFRSRAGAGRSTDPRPAGERGGLRAAARAARGVERAAPVDAGVAVFPGADAGRARLPPPARPVCRLPGDHRPRGQLLQPVPGRGTVPRLWTRGADGADDLAPGAESAAVSPADAAARRRAG